MEFIAQPPTHMPPNFIFDKSMKMRMQEKPVNCPWCASAKIALILNGMPVFIPELENELDAGAIAIGNPDHDREEPAWQCTDCGAHFFRASV